MAAAARPRLAVVWAAGCGGCEMSFLDLGDGLLRLERDFELVFFPLLADHKSVALAGAVDDPVDLCLFTGAIRSEHDVELARLCRRAATTLVAFGACAELGSVLTLADLDPVAELLDTVYRRSPSMAAAAGEEGQPRGASRGQAVEGLGLPALTPTVQPLTAIVPVDYTVPGCPPEVERLAEVLELFRAAAEGRSELPPPGSVLGASDAAVCEECPRPRPRGGVSQFRRLHEAGDDQLLCLLDHGLLCCGPATRGGCGARCPAVGASCGGCYGPLPAVADQGARMLGVLATVLGDGGDGVDGADDRQLRARLDDVAGELLDPVGSLYRYSFARSLLARLRRPHGGSGCGD